VRRAGLLLGLLLSGCTRPRQEVWLAPNLGTPDLPELFAHPEAWGEARKRTTVLKLYASEILADSARDCPACEGNLMPALRGSGAFAALDAWRIGLAVEVPVLKTWSCTGDGERVLALRVLDRVREAGGHVRSLAMDEPFIGGRTCGLGTTEVADRIDAFARAVRAKDGDVEVGEIEGYPALEPEALGRLLLALRLRGVPLAFFHLDVDRRVARRQRRTLGAEIQPVASLCRLLGIPFGLIVWGQDDEADAAWVDDARAWVQEARTSVGEPDDWIFQSWAESQDGRRRVPATLPEAGPATETSLLLETLRHP
jgi:hypothetical protein